MKRLFNYCCQLCLLLTLALGSAALAEIDVQATPDGGVQPRLSVDESGNVHLLYFKKRLPSSPRAREGNLYYRQYHPEQKRFGQPVRVSSEAFDIRTFSIGRASVAVAGVCAVTCAASSDWSRMVSDARYRPMCGPSWTSPFRLMRARC